MNEKKRGRPFGTKQERLQAIERAEGLLMAVRTTLDDLDVAEMAIDQNRPDVAKRLIVEVKHTLTRASR